jgi:hypothetical protein
MFARSWRRVSHRFQYSRQFGQGYAVLIEFVDNPAKTKFVHLVTRDTKPGMHVDAFFVL